MLKLLLIFAVCIQDYLFAVIDSNNCINGANIITTCGYKIDFSNIGYKSLHCTLEFTLSNATVKFSNYFIWVKRQTNNQCPDIEMNIITNVDGKATNNKLSTTCGGTIEKIERNFSNFLSFVIKLDTKDLNDQDSKVNMSLAINGDCTENGYVWRGNSLIMMVMTIIGILFAFIVLIIIPTLVVLYCYQKRNHSAVSINVNRKPRKGKKKDI